MFKEVKDIEIKISELDEEIYKLNKSLDNINIEYEEYDIVENKIISLEKKISDMKILSSEKYKYALKYGKRKVCESINICSSNIRFVQLNEMFECMYCEKKLCGQCTIISTEKYYVCSSCLFKEEHYNYTRCYSCSKKMPKLYEKKCHIIGCNMTSEVCEVCITNNITCTSDMLKIICDDVFEEKNIILIIIKYLYSDYNYDSDMNNIMKYKIKSMNKNNKIIYRQIQYPFYVSKKIIESDEDYIPYYKLYDVIDNKYMNNYSGNFMRIIYHPPKKYITNGENSCTCYPGKILIICKHNIICETHIYDDSLLQNVIVKGEKNEYDFAIPYNSDIDIGPVNIVYSKKKLNRHNILSPIKINGIFTKEKKINATKFFMKNIEIKKISENMYVYKLFTKKNNIIEYNGVLFKHVVQ